MKFVQSNLYLYFFLMALGISGFFLIFLWPTYIGFYAFMVFAAAGGIGVASYIYHTKKSGKQLVCPVGSDCNAVINSHYSKFLGVSLEYWGLLYYSIIFISYLILIFAPQVFSSLFLFGLSLLTMGAFLFSLYLLFAQAFLLKQWCIWCLLSAMLSISIFLLSLVSLDFAIAFLYKMADMINIIRNLGLALGVGGATVALLYFFKSLRDLNIDDLEIKKLKFISEFIWAGLALVFISNAVELVIHTEVLVSSSFFLISMIVFFVILVCSAILMIIFTPLLGMISFDERSPTHVHSQIESLRRPLFFFGAVAVSSWYYVFLLNFVTGYEFKELLAFYIGTLFFAILAAIFVEHKIEKGTLVK